MGKIRKTGGSGSSQRRPAPDKCWDSSTGNSSIRARSVNSSRLFAKRTGGCCFREASRYDTGVSVPPRRGLPHETPSRLCVRSSVCSLVPPFVRAYVRLSGKRVHTSAHTSTAHFIPKPSHGLLDDHILWDPIMNRRFLSDHLIKTRIHTHRDTHGTQLEETRERLGGSGNRRIWRRKTNPNCSILRPARENAAATFECHFEVNAAAAAAAAAVAVAPSSSSS